MKARTQLLFVANTILRLISPRYDMQKKVTPIASVDPAGVLSGCFCTEVLRLSNL